ALPVLGVEALLQLADTLAFDLPERLGGFLVVIAVEVTSGVGVGVGEPKGGRVIDPMGADAPGDILERLRARAHAFAPRSVPDRCVDHYRAWAMPASPGNEKTNRPQGRSAGQVSRLCA